MVEAEILQLSLQSIQLVYLCYEPKRNYLAVATVWISVTAVDCIWHVGLQRMEE